MLNVTYFCRLFQKDLLFSVLWPGSARQAKRRLTIPLMCPCVKWKRDKSFRSWSLKLKILNLESPHRKILSVLYSQSKELSQGSKGFLFSLYTLRFSYCVFCRFLTRKTTCLISSGNKKEKSESREAGAQWEEPDKSFWRQYSLRSV